MKEKRPSIFRVIQVDYLAFIASIAFTFFWIFYFYDMLVAKNVVPNLLYWVLAVTVISIAVLVWRYVSILVFYGMGIEIKAIVNSVSFFRDRGKIAYIYTYQGQKYLSGNSVMKTKRTKMYKVGDKIDVLLDRNNPKRAVIKDLYL